MGKPNRPTTVLTRSMLLPGMLLQRAGGGIGTVSEDPHHPEKLVPTGDDEVVVETAHPYYKGKELKHRFRKVVWPLDDRVVIFGEALPVVHNDEQAPNPVDEERAVSRLSKVLERKRF